MKTCLCVCVCLSVYLSEYVQNRRQIMYMTRFSCIYWKNYNKWINEWMFLRVIKNWVKASFVLHQWYFTSVIAFQFNYSLLQWQHNTVSILLLLHNTFTSTFSFSLTVHSVQFERSSFTFTYQIALNWTQCHSTLFSFKNARISSDLVMRFLRPDVRKPQREKILSK